VLGFLWSSSLYDVCWDFFFLIENLAFYDPSSIFLGSANFTYCFVLTSDNFPAE
jgi:hypothetical protein